jgi:diaminopimelate decarboxylase
MVRQFGEDMTIQPLDKKVEEREKIMTTWWGQTCDSCDWIAKNEMHYAMETGEWVCS